MGISEELVNVGVEETHVVFKVSLCLIRGWAAGEVVLSVWIEVQFEIFLNADIIVILIAEEPPVRRPSRDVITNLSPNFVGELSARSFWPFLYAFGVCPISAFRKCNSLYNH